MTKMAARSLSRRCAIMLLALILIFACATAGNAAKLLDEQTAIANVHAYIKLLTQQTPPTLAELERHGRADLHGELEVMFLLKKCREMGWEESGTECIDFEHTRWKAEAKSPSLYLTWLRKRFSTVNAPTRIIRTWKDGAGWKRGNNKRSFHAEIQIGENTFETFESTFGPGGMGFENVNGKSVFDLVKAHTEANVAR